MRHKKVYILKMDQDGQSAKILGVFDSINKARDKMLYMIGTYISSAIEADLFYKPQDLKNDFRQYNVYIHDNCPKNAKPYSSLCNESKNIINRLREANNYLVTNYSVSLLDFFDLTYMSTKSNNDYLGNKMVKSNEIVYRYNCKCRESHKNTFEIVISHLM